MRRQLVDADFPLHRVGTAIFSAADPVPLFVGDDVDAADTLHRLISIGYDTSQIVARSQHPDHVGAGVLDLFAVRDPELPLSTEPGGWTLDAAVKQV